MQTILYWQTLSYIGGTQYGIILCVMSLERVVALSQLLFLCSIWMPWWCYCDNMLCIIWSLSDIILDIIYCDTPIFCNNGINTYLLLYLIIILKKLKKYRLSEALVWAAGGVQWRNSEFNSTRNMLSMRMLKTWRLVDMTAVSYLFLTITLFDIAYWHRAHSHNIHLPTHSKQTTSTLYPNLKADNNNNDQAKKRRRCHRRPLPPLPAQALAL